jgi:hypothetical protein
MNDTITWAPPRMTKTRGRRQPDFDVDEGFTVSWWGENTDFSPPDYQWRSYSRDGQEVARLLLSLRFPSHSVPAVPAVLIWNFEVHRGLQRSGAHIGSRIVVELTAEYRTQEIYIGPTPESVGFWRRFGWPMCDCDDCGGRDFILRRP